MAIDLKCDKCGSTLDPYNHLIMSVLGTNTGQMEFCLDCAAPIVEMNMVKKVLDDKAPEPMPWGEDVVEPSEPRPPVVKDQMPTDYS